MFVRRRGTLGTIALCAVLTACGDDDDDTATPDSNAGKGGSSAAGRGGAGGRAGAGGNGGSGKAGSAGQSISEDAGPGEDAGAVEPNDKFSFFVTSDTSKTGDLGGLSGADKRCQTLAAAASTSAGAKTWHAYLSVEHDAANGDKARNAHDRIGSGPWYNVKGVLLAQDLSALHARKGDANLFLDERGGKVNGQWIGSPTPNEHDVLTGSNADGTLLAGKTCADWTSSAMDLTAQVGHADGLGPMQNGDPPYDSWNSSHENGGCNDTAPRGGAGKLYCFAVE